MERKEAWDLLKKILEESQSFKTLYSL